MLHLCCNHIFEPTTLLFHRSAEQDSETNQNQQSKTNNITYKTAEAHCLKNSCRASPSLLQFSVLLSALVLNFFASICREQPEYQKPTNGQVNPQRYVWRSFLQLLPYIPEHHLPSNQASLRNRLRQMFHGVALAARLHASGNIIIV